LPSLFPATHNSNYISYVIRPPPTERIQNYHIGAGTVKLRLAVDGVYNSPSKADGQIPGIVIVRRRKRRGNLRLYNNNTHNETNPGTVIVRSEAT
ncbi:hypothetical protein KAR91_25090, partial [Candidatus Pacearchaeota archaeon]|nr:hypothetical protein [Candidatus Pacearchaeota archaeon]